MTLKQAYAHMAEFVKTDPMKVIALEDDMLEYFCKQMKENFGGITYDTDTKDGDTIWRINMTKPIEYKTSWYDCTILAKYEAAVYFIHNYFEAFANFYDYPKKQAEEIIKNGFPD